MVEAEQVALEVETLSYISKPSQISKDTPII
nr:MAG TPA: hypothetical protein [Caudoviricetes sp.]